jgi:diketogulonate reductase-like aldo/keto reductase
LMLTGAACPKCGYGTRKTSKNWRRCKRESCGERIQMVEATQEGIAQGAKMIDEAIKRCK